MVISFLNSLFLRVKNHHIIVSQYFVQNGTVSDQLSSTKYVDSKHVRNNNLCDLLKSEFIIVLIHSRFVINGKTND